MQLGRTAGSPTARNSGLAWRFRYPSLWFGEAFATTALRDTTPDPRGMIWCRLAQTDTNNTATSTGTNAAPQADQALAIPKYKYPTTLQIEKFIQTFEKSVPDDPDLEAAEIHGWRQVSPTQKYIFGGLEKWRVRRKINYDAYQRRQAIKKLKMAKLGKQETPPRKWPARDLLHNSDLKLRLNFIPKEYKALLQQELDKAAIGIGNNPSYNIEEKRMFMLGLRRFFEKQARAGPPKCGFDMFARDPGHAGALLLDDDAPHEEDEEAEEAK